MNIASQMNHGNWKILFCQTDQSKWFFPEQSLTTLQIIKMLSNWQITFGQRFNFYLDNIITNVTAFSKKLKDEHELPATVVDKFHRKMLESSCTQNNC